MHQTKCVAISVDDGQSRSRTCHDTTPFRAILNIDITKNNVSRGAREQVVRYLLLSERRLEVDTKNLKAINLNHDRVGCRANGRDPGAERMRAEAGDTTRLMPVGVESSKGRVMKKVRVLKNESMVDKPSLREEN